MKSVPESDWKKLKVKEDVGSKTTYYYQFV